MIFDHIKNLSLYTSIIPRIDNLAGFLEKADSLEFSQWENITPEMKVIKLNQFSKEEAFEFHQKYIDVHITLEGIDEIILGKQETGVFLAEFDTSLDYQLVEAESIASIKGSQGFFTIILPGEIHRNRFLETDTIKLVFKIATHAKV